MSNFNNNIDLSIIIIGYNEERNIKRTIDAIKNMNLDGLNIEMIYVDSNSKDNSINKLKKYEDVKIYKIQANRYTASLARFVGSQVAKGEYILFLDADMEIESNTNIRECIEILENDERIGVLSGKLPEIWYINEKAVNKLVDRYDVRKEIEELNDPGGYFMIRNDLLKEVGNFNIELSCNEEIDLFSRIKKIKPKLVRTNKMSCIHHFYMNDDSKKNLTRFKKGYYGYFWKVMFDNLKNNNLKEYLSFKTQLKTLRSTILTLAMIISLFLAIKYKVMLIIPIIYYIILILKKKFDIKYINYNQINNILRLISIVFIFKSEHINYKIEYIDR